MVHVRREGLPLCRFIHMDDPCEFSTRREALALVVKLQRKGMIGLELHDGRCPDRVPTKGRRIAGLIRSAVLPALLLMTLGGCGSPPPEAPKMHPVEEEDPEAMKPEILAYLADPAWAVKPFVNPPVLPPEAGVFVELTTEDQTAEEAYGGPVPESGIQISDCRWVMYDSKRVVEFSTCNLKVTP